MNTITLMYRNQSKVVDLNACDISGLKNIVVYVQAQIGKIHMRLRRAPVISIKSMCKLTDRLGELLRIMDSIRNHLATLN